MMGADQIKITRTAARILDVYVPGYRACWVCANRGHSHKHTGCPLERCPCGRRALAPRCPAWVGALS